MQSKPPVFRDEKLQQEFDENGFVKFKLFDAQQIERIHNFYLEHQDEHETIIEKKKFHATNETSNAELIAKADSFIKELMMEEVNKHFRDYKVIAANYLIKQPDIKSELGPHQDLRFVDEEKYYSLNIWIATEATNKHNGCLRFIKGSHLWSDTIRPLPSYPWKYRNAEQLLTENFTDVTTDIGECVVLNHACIHSSYPNLSEKIRVAAIMAIIPQDAEILHYFLPDGNPENEVEKYTMTLQDFITLKVGQRPDSAVLVDKFKYDFSAANIEMIKAKLNLLNSNTTNSDILYGKFKRKLSSLFGISG